MKKIVAVPKPTPTPPYLKDWETMFRLVATYTTQYRLSPEVKTALALFMVTLHNFNAQFSLSETDKLHYETTPFSVQWNNPYRRTAEHPFENYVRSYFMSCIEWDLAWGEPLIESRNILCLEDLQVRSLFPLLFNVVIPKQTELGEIRIDFEDEYIQRTFRGYMEWLTLINQGTWPKKHPDRMIFIDLTSFYDPKQLRKSIKEISSLVQKINRQVFDWIKPQFPKGCEPKAKKLRSRLETIMGIGFFSNVGNLSFLVLPKQRLLCGDMKYLLSQYGYKPELVSYARKVFENEHLHTFPNRHRHDDGAIVSGICLKAERCPDFLPESERVKSELTNLAKILRDTPFCEEEDLTSSLVPSSRLYQFHLEFTNLSTIPWKQFYVLAFSKLIQRSGILNVSGIEGDLIKSRLVKGMKGAIEATTFTQFIRSIQDISDAILLYCFTSPLVQLSPFHTIIRDRFSRLSAAENLQGVYLRSFAMQGFSQILLSWAEEMRHHKKENGIVQVFNQNYHELLGGLQRLQGANGALNLSIALGLEVHDVDQSADIIFIDTHPNNAAEKQLFPHNVSSLIQRRFEDQSATSATIVVDITFNHLSGRELEPILRVAKPFIDNGKLNLIFVGSLHKFGVLGVDKLSGGLVMSYNKSCFWGCFNEFLKGLDLEAPADPAAHRFFGLFFQFLEQEQVFYLNKIRSNTQFLYKQVRDLCNTLQIRDCQWALDLTNNSDSDTCYIALNYMSFVRLMDPEYRLTDVLIDEFNTDVLKRLIMPLAEHWELPLTNRTSFGFSVSNIAECGQTLRWTLGIEPEEDLEKHAEILAFSTFILNRYHLVSELSDRTTRLQYFDKMVEIYKVMSQSTEESMVFEQLTSDGAIRFKIQSGTIKAELERGSSVNFQEKDIVLDTQISGMSRPCTDLSRMQKICLSTYLDRIKFFVWYETVATLVLCFEYLNVPIGFRPKTYKIGCVYATFELTSDSDISVDLPGIPGCLPSSCSIVYRENGRNYSLTELLPGLKTEIFEELNHLKIVPMLTSSNQKCLIVEGWQTIWQRDGVNIRFRSIAQVNLVEVNISLWGIKRLIAAGLLRMLWMVEGLKKQNIEFAIPDNTFERVILQKCDFDKYREQLIAVARRIVGNSSILINQITAYLLREKDSSESRTGLEPTTFGSNHPLDGYENYPLYHQDFLLTLSK